MVNINVVVLVDMEGNSASGSADNLADALDSAEQLWNELFGRGWDRRIDMEMSIDIKPSVVKIDVPATGKATVSVR